MTDYSKIKKLIKDADAILIGAGSGLSSSAGLLYSGKKFEEEFQDYIKKYKITDLYSSSFYPFKTEEERWAYWAKHIYFSYYEEQENKTYKTLLNLVKDKDYFVITTNCDGQFLKNKFPKEKVFEVQGSYSKIQCAKACHNTLYDNKKLVYEMLEKTDENLKIPTTLVPKCPVCGGKMNVNLRCDEYFVEDDNWHKLCNNYEKFINKYQNKKLLLIELGVGFNTPGIIRFPFEEMTLKLKNTHLIRVNDKSTETFLDISVKTTLVKEDCKSFLTALTTT